MKATIELDDEVLEEAKRAAIASGRSLAAVVEDALRDTLAHQRVELERQGDQLAQQRAQLAEQRAQLRRPPVRLPTYPGWGLRPGLDLDDMASVLDFLDHDDGTS